MQPQSRIGLAKLTKLAFDGVDLQPLRSRLLTQYATDPQHAGALMDLSVIDQLQGQRDSGLEWQAKAFETCRLFRTERVDRPRKTLLVFAAAIDIGGNTPIEFLLKGSDFDIVFYYPVPGATTDHPLPAHDAAFCAAPTDGNQAAPFFETVRRITRTSTIKVHNLPSGDLSLDRETLSDIAVNAPGVRLPHTLRVSRAIVADMVPVDAPYLIRPIGSHAGRGLAKISNACDLATYLSKHPDPEFSVSQFIDYASPGDGCYRKYRIVFVDGRPMPCHMAISDTWDVWYLNADMDKCATKRAEEAAFLNTFDESFGRRHADALKAVAEAIDLDYFGIDCAEAPDGSLVVFEADNALIVHDMDIDALFPYKRVPMQAIFYGVERMLMGFNEPTAQVIPLSRWRSRPKSASVQ